VYSPNLDSGLQAAPGARSYRDYRKLLEDKSIDAVIVATPDHWHARMVIDAVEAGKDVYVEKPLAHEIGEGFRIVEAVRRTKRVVQVGTQRRSAPLFHAAKKVVDSGALGEVRFVNAWWVNHQQSLRQAKLDGTLDWEQWLGSAPRRPVDATRFFNWYYFWDYSGGLMVGQAAHVVDAIQWFMNSSAPLAVTCAAGRNNLAGGEVPETTTMCIEFPENYLATFSVAYKAMRYNPRHDQLKQFHGSKARFDVGREDFALYPESKELELKPSQVESKPGSFPAATRLHVQNFLESVRSRQEPNAPVEAGQATNIALCMAMESLKTGRRIKWDSGARKMV
jgi:predicted dehydrogenase